MLCVGIFVKHYALCIEAKKKKKKKNCKPEQREDNCYNFPMGRNKFIYELMFWLISIKTVANKKSKNALRVEINQFCDG